MAIIVPKRVSKTIMVGGMRTVWRLIRRMIFDRDHRVHRAIRRIYHAEVIDSLELNYYRAIANYVPPKIDSSIYCILCKASSKMGEFSPSAWKGLGRELQCKIIAGEHESCITIHIDELAKQIRRALAASFTGKRLDGGAAS